jgi:hypothetical protein
LLDQAANRSCDVMTMASLAKLCPSLKRFAIDRRIPARVCKSFQRRAGARHTVKPLPSDACVKKHGHACLPRFVENVHITALPMIQKA